ncbi:MAG: hypothetical protein OXI91_12350 [Chloroflexota bacterium]|nr:hypothetical protein [Chloroflexota bacterium]
MSGMGLWLSGQWLGSEIPSLLLGLGFHHDDIVDPDFLAWLKARLDHLITLDPWVLIVLLTLVVLAIPAAILGFYLYQQWRVRLS